MHTNRSPGSICLESYRTCRISTSADPRRIRYSRPSIKSESRMTNPFRQPERLLNDRALPEMLQGFTRDLAKRRRRNRSAPTEGSRFVDDDNDGQLRALDRNEP